MYITINGQNIYYQKIGGGKPLIMLHGWGQDVSTFWQNAKGLEDKFTIFLIDLPGFGRSDLPKKTFTVTDYAEIVKKFIEKMALKKVNLLGHSLGGRIAIKLAMKNPKLLDKLILEDSAGIRPKKGFITSVSYVFSKFFNLFFPNIFNLKEKIKYGFYSSIGSDYLTTGKLKETFKNIIGEDLTHQLPKVQTDTLLLWGENDQTEEASLENGKKMYHLIPNSRIEIFEGVGHFPHLEMPERFTNFVKDFC